MSIIIETAESGSLNFGAQGGGQKLVMFFDGYDDPADVWLAALSQTGPYLNGFIRNDIAVEPEGGLAWRVTVSYGTSGVGGGPYPLGGPASDNAPVSPPTGDPGGGNATDSTVLTQGFRFGIAFNSQKFTQSLATISSTTDGIDPVTDFKQAIGVGQDGKVEGCDVPAAPKVTFERQVARATVTVGYFKTLRNLVGKTNNATFFSQAVGEVLYLGCDAEYQQSSGWSLTHKFGCEENKAGIVVSPSITVANKKGWEYLWVAYKEVIDSNGKITTVPFQANVERVFDSGNFANLEIGV